MAKKAPANDAQPTPEEQNQKSIEEVQLHGKRFTSTTQM